MKVSFDLQSIYVAAAAFGGKIFAKGVMRFLHGEVPIDRGLPIPTIRLTDLDRHISRLSCNFAYLSTTILRECIAFPSLNFDCNINTLSQRFTQFLMKKVIDIKAVNRPEDIMIDEEGNLVWSIYDPNDPIPINKRKVVFINSNYTSFFENVTDWSQQFGSGIDAYHGMSDNTKVDETALKKSLTYLPSKVWWSHLTFGNGAASGLQGIASQIIAMKILVETNQLSGVIVVSSVSRSYHLPYHIVNRVRLYPDVIIISEATGKVAFGPCGFAIGQNGRAMVEVVVKRGFSIEDGARVVAEAAVADMNRSKADLILGPVSRSATEAIIASGKFNVRFLRTLAVGETGDDALEEIESLPSVRKALKLDGCVAQSRFESFPAWKTPRDHSALLLASETYRRTVSPYLDESQTLESLKKHPFFIARGRGDDSTGYPISATTIPGTGSRPVTRKWIKMANSESGSVSDSIDLGNQMETETENKNEIEAKTIFINKGKNVKGDNNYNNKGSGGRGAKVMPPVFAIGSGFVENAGRPGEFVNNDLVWAPIAVMARFPSMLVENRY